MQWIFRSGAILGLVLSSTLPTLAAEPSPVGVWAAKNQESRYEFSYCGDGTQLCARLVWIRADKQSKKNMAEMGKLLLDHAKPKSGNRWTGKIRIAGDVGDGVVELRSATSMNIRACKMFVLCAEVDLVPPKD